MPTNTKLVSARSLMLAAGMLAATTAMGAAASMSSIDFDVTQSAPPEKSRQSSGSSQAGPPTGAKAQEKTKRAEGEGDGEEKAGDDEKKRGGFGAGGTTRPPKNPDQRRTQPLPTFMKQFDTDGNGMISPDERKAGKTKIDAYHAKLTVAVDTNKNKTIDADEWHKSGFDLSRPKGTAQPNARVKAMQERMEARRKMRFDTDRDGVLSEVETKAYNASIQMRYLSVLERIDLNGDGAIDDAERKAYAAKVKHSRRNTPAAPKKTDPKKTESDRKAKKQSGTAGPPARGSGGTGSTGP